MNSRQIKVKIKGIIIDIGTDNDNIINSLRKHA